jgi:hypothetical protein
MASLYDISVGSYLQGLAGVAGTLEKGRQKLAEDGGDPDGILETRLFADMLPFKFQIISVCHHSLGAIRGIERGEFNPPGAVEATTYADFQKLVEDTRDGLKALSPDAVNAWAGKDVNFKLGAMTMPFEAETFVLSFSLPNFYFHAATAYDILRIQGAKLGKRDFMGAVRMKQPA